MSGIVILLLELITWYNRGKYHHAEKDGNNVQGRFVVESLVSTSGYLSVERRGGNGIVMCNFGVVCKKGRICWTTTMGQHEEIPNDMSQSIYSCSVGNGRHHFHKGL